MKTYLEKVKSVNALKNKYGIEFNVGDYVFLPLQFYSYGIWKITKIVDETSVGGSGRLWVDQGSEEKFNGKEDNRHIRGVSIDNPFIKVDKKCGEFLFDNNVYEEKLYEAFK